MDTDFQPQDSDGCDIELFFNRPVAPSSPTESGVNHQGDSRDFLIVHAVVPQSRLWQTLMTWREHLAGVDVADLFVRVKYSTKFPMKHQTREIPFAAFWRLHFLQGLTDELKRGTLQCKFQPIVSRVHRSIFGYELLANFRDEKFDLGAVEILRQARGEQERLALEGLFWTTSLKQLRHLPGNALGFVNLNPEIFFQGITDWRRTDRELVASSVPPSRVVVELLETETPYEECQLKSFVAECRRRGFAIAIDDWGQHLGNLKILESTRPDFIKLEVQMVKGAYNDPYRRRMIESVIELCRSLDTRVVLEGIETVEDWEWAKDSLADFLQGYHLGRPQRSPVDCPLPTATIKSAAAPTELPSTV